MNKPISTLAIDRNIAQKLMQLSIVKVKVIKYLNKVKWFVSKIFQKKDLLAKTPMDLVKLLNFSLSKAENILEQAFKCSPVNPVNVNILKIVY